MSAMVSPTLGDVLLAVTVGVRLAVIVTDPFAVPPLPSVTVHVSVIDPPLAGV